MSLSSVPYDAPVTSRAKESTVEDVSIHSLRMRRFRRNLIWLIGIVVLLVGLRRIVDPGNRASNEPQNQPVQKKPPLDFKIVMDRYEAVKETLSKREHVEALIGPPTDLFATGPEIDEAEKDWWRFGKNMFWSKDRAWHRWSDPKDPNRWVLIAYTGPRGQQKIYKVFKKGF